MSRTNDSSSQERFTPLPARVDLPALEHEVLGRWRDSKVFERSLDQTAGGEPWVFYEGPPTANGMPGVHHVEARVFKDVFPRFKTMKGFNVQRKAGWDCHGLPVEVAVEKELGLSGKKDIESYGISEFNARCRESVLRHVDAFERMTERMGYWVDMSQAYRTMDASYVESVWWSLKVIFDKGLLVRDFRISPYCPRCGTTLSDHELGQPGGYESIIDPSVTVRFPITGDVPEAHPKLAGADLLAWTTTPWTLVSTAAVAVNPSVTYVIAVRSGTGDRVVVAEELMARVLGEGWYATDRLPGSELEGVAYQRPFELIDIIKGNRVVLGDFVTVEDGTGLVQMAPAYGADDNAVCTAYGIPTVVRIGPDGKFDDDIALVGGRFFRDANPYLVQDLDDRGLLFASAEYEHNYPHCWRCHTPLIYYALPAWYIKTTEIKERLLAENAKTGWHPESIKWGRYGEWLRNNIDWSLSRTRYWGTPLPLWVCEDEHVTCAGSLAELGELAGRDLSALDPHRPYVDDIAFACPGRSGDAPSAGCGKLASRVPDVIDAWYDSGSMPFAQFGAPYRNAVEAGRAYPAQFISEAIDQTRGWFYSLMAVGTLVFDESSYENVVCLGHILAEDGRKMSKHLGNVLEPMPLMDAHGADALRWFMACSGSPWASRRIGKGALEEIVRKVLLTYWNTASFLVLYANAAGEQGDAWTPARMGEAPSVNDRPLLDRWVLAELHRTVAAVDEAMESFDTAVAGRRLADFVDDLSNWYVRRSRRRFWGGPGTPEGAAAFATLYECVETLTQLMAPFTPFVTDYVWNVLRAEGSPESVHLAAWPQADPELIDEDLTRHMALVRRLVELGRAARASSSVRTRQPLGRALVGASGWASLPEPLRALIAEELNVQEMAALAAVGGELVDYEVKPNFRALGRRFGKDTPKVAAAVGAADPATLAHALRDNGAVTCDVPGTGPAELGPRDLIVTERPRSGWAVESTAGETVALDLTITPALRRAGLAREVVRLVQEARKATGLEVTDRIELWWQAGTDELRTALAEHRTMIAAEVLAGSWYDGRPSGGLKAHRDEELRLTFWLRRTGA